MRKPHLVLPQHEVILLGTVHWEKTLLAIKNWGFVTHNSLFINHGGVRAAHPSWINH